MWEAYLPVESGALGPEENFLSLDDILMSQEKLPVRVETSMPRLGAFFLERGADAESDHALPQATSQRLRSLAGVPPKSSVKGCSLFGVSGSSVPLAPLPNKDRVTRPGSSSFENRRHWPFLPSLKPPDLRLISLCSLLSASRLGTKLELPLWLAKGLFDTKRRILSVELPKMYQEGWRTVFSADANVVDLHKMGPHFYGFGSQLLHFDSPENADISQSLLQTFIGRFRRIMDSSQNSYNEDTSALVARLDEMERGLFQIGQKGLNDFQSWEKGQASQITASNLVQNYKKRKFTNMED
ncbi:DNA replication complex GINS protein PSF3 isoform X1 [Onychomys torridus]|uniref:DNA replication complex GINS protein PSF3 isoform X1 n=1 Tax=Onychomys torridus TaxID=38674 RepID=UPI00167F34B3|nr:DNA replication complex GINS protein PSF3 isoform X1 [Onychomys torridus]